MTFARLTLQAAQHNTSPGVLIFTEDESNDIRAHMEARIRRTKTGLIPVSRTYRLGRTPADIVARLRQREIERIAREQDRYHIGEYTRSSDYAAPVPNPDARLAGRVLCWTHVDGEDKQVIVEEVPRSKLIDMPIGAWCWALDPPRDRAHNVVYPVAPDLTELRDPASIPNSVPLQQIVFRYRQVQFGMSEMRWAMERVS